MGVNSTQEGTFCLLGFFSVTTLAAHTLDMSPSYNVYIDGCPARQVLDRLADKWALLILARLQNEAVRFNQLRRDIDGISQKVLSQTLKKLERDGLLSRSVFATVPVTVEYALTDLGQSLVQTVHTFAHWAERHMEAVLVAQTKYDACVVSDPGVSPM